MINNVVLLCSEWESDSEDEGGCEESQEEEMKNASTSSCKQVNINFAYCLNLCQKFKVYIIFKINMSECPFLFFMYIEFLKKAY